MSSRFLSYVRMFGDVFPLFVGRLVFLIQARIHRHTYKVVPNPRNIVVIGGSYAGLMLADQLANSLPTGYRVVLIEKRSHFNFTWIFPRVSVVDDHEHKAFIPYGPGLAALPNGSLLFCRGTALSIDGKKVTLQDGTEFEYAYLALATGSTGAPPWGSNLEEKRDGTELFRRMQKDIRDARDLVIVGGGAVGVELASDAKSKYPQKNVTLIHSRERLLNTFGPRLHEYALERLQLLGVDVHLGERVSEDAGKETPSIINLKSGKMISCDLFIKCTGQKPASDIVATLSPSLISSSGTVLVKKTLQVDDTTFANVFALGDVAETGCVKMGRTAGIQASVVGQNIVRAIKRQPLKEYRSFSFFESGINLTLGLLEGVTYFKDGGHEFLFPGKKQIALDSKQAWTMNGARPFVDPEYENKTTA